MAGEIISDEVLRKIEMSLSEGNNWMAYNNSLYFIDPGDIFFFDNRDSANEFADNNVSDHDHFSVMYISTVEDIRRHLSINSPLHNQIADPDANGLHNMEGNAFTDALIEHIEQQQILNTKKTNFMNQKNFEFLKDQVKFTGFGSVLENELKGNLQKQAQEFQMTATTMFGNDDVVAKLHFKKSEQSDMYFFNRYQVSLTPEQSKDKMEQTFYINKGNNITLKEAYNLMNGRAVNKTLTNKENQLYNSWVQLDFKQTDTNGNYKMKHFHENYGYDMNAVLAKHPIKELSSEIEKTKLIDSLQKGNRQSVTFLQNGGEQRHFIEANPQFKTINVYDSDMQRIVNRQGHEEKQGQGEQKSAKQSAKSEQQSQGDAEGGEGVPKASSKRRKKQSNHIS